MTGPTGLPLPLPPEWMADALCAQVGGEAWFPEKGGSTREAKKVCGGCEVRQQCLEYALSTGERFGIWGGLSERERRRIRPLPAETPLPRPRLEIAHGGEAGAAAHRRRGEKPCASCLQGEARATQERAARRTPPAAAPARPWTPDEQAAAVRFLTDAGLAAEEIAPELGMTLRHVQRIQRQQRRGAA